MTVGDFDLEKPRIIWSSPKMVKTMAAHDIAFPAQAKMMTNTPMMRCAKRTIFTPL